VRCSICYDVADIETKNQIIGSIFPEKLIYENKKYRTAKIEDVVELLCLSGKNWGRVKKESIPFMRCFPLTYTQTHYFRTKLNKIWLELMD
jgi:hypothetical protein